MSMFNRWCLDEDPAGWRDGKTASHKAHLAIGAIAALGSVASAVGANRAASVREKQYEMQKKAMWVGFDKRAGLFSSVEPGFDPAQAGLLGRARIGLTRGSILPAHEYDEDSPTGRIGGYALMSEDGHISHLDHPKLKKAVEETDKGRAALAAFHAHREKRATVFKIPHGEHASSTMDKLRRLMGKPGIAKK